MTGNALLRKARTIWSKLKTFHAGRLRPFLKNARLSCACCRRTLKFFINTPHFPTVVIAVSVVATIFANVTPPDPNSASAWGHLWQGSRSAPPEDKTSSDGYEFTGILHPGDSLTSSFQRYEVPDSVGQQVIQALRGAIDFRNLRPRDRYSLRLDSQGELQECTFESGPLNVHRVSRHQDGNFYAERLSVPLERRTVKVSGEVSQSLYDAFVSSREEPRLIYAFADIFASRIDFNTETRIGDRFSMVFEKYFKDGDFVGYGKILLARYERTNSESLEGYYYTPPGADRGAYYDGNGEELGAFFIRSPVPMARVSSGFTMSRMHPILQFSRPHPGVDLAAPTGTPVMAAADGRVSSMGWNGGYGKQIVIEHGNGYRTMYSHLSGYRAGLAVGSRVTQKTVIGYVGSTGLSTGPHLDYRVQANGAYINPFAMKSKPRSVLRGQELARFLQQQNVLARLSDSLDDPRAVMVNSVTVTPESKFTFL
ncbi:MAG: peptidoglycan DD-metalloendopeptidase family protein [Thermodesulfobacteriota bacterium]